MRHPFSKHAHPDHFLGLPSRIFSTASRKRIASGWPRQCDARQITMQWRFCGALLSLPRKALPIILNAIARCCGELWIFATRGNFAHTVKSAKEQIVRFDSSTQRLLPVRFVSLDSVNCGGKRRLEKSQSMSMGLWPPNLNAVHLPSAPSHSCRAEFHLCRARRLGGLVGERHLTFENLALRGVRLITSIPITGRRYMDIRMGQEPEVS